MTIWDSIILGIVEGLTEFLPVSSTGHLTIVSKMLGLKIDDPSITGYTAVIQIGAIAAVVLYFWKDIRRIAIAWVRGIAKPEHRGEFDHRMGWYVIVGSMPIVHRRLPGAGPDLGAAAQPVVGGRRPDRVVVLHGRRRAAGHEGAAADPHHAGRRDRDGRRAVPRADPRCVPVRRDDLGRPVLRPRPGRRDADRVPAGHSGPGRGGDLRVEGCAQR